MQLWDASTGKPLRDWSMGFDCFALSPDGKTLVRGTDAGLIRLCDIAGGKPDATLAELDRVAGVGGFGGPMFNRTSISRMLFSPDGKMLAVVTSHPRGNSPLPSYNLRLIDAAAGKELYDFGQNAQGIGRLLFSPNGTKFLFSEITNSFYLTSKPHLWDLAARKELPLPNVADTQVLLFAADSKSFGVATGKVAEGTAPWRYGASKPASRCAICQSRRHMNTLPASPQTAR